MDEERDDLTPDEAEGVESGSMDAEEAHRAGEFDELRDMLGKIMDAIESLGHGIDSVRESVAAFVENGAVISETADAETGSDDVPEDDVAEFVYALDDLDLDM